MNINQVCVSGNVSTEPELRTTPNGNSVLLFNIAVSKRVLNNSTGAWEDRPNYFSCVLFGSRAEALSKFVTKGVKVMINGELRWSQWEKDGRKQSKVEIVVSNIDVCPKKAQSSPEKPIEMASEDYKF